MPAESPIRQQRTSQEKYDTAREMRQRMTREERLVWSRIRANRLGGFHFRRQQVIEPYIVDFYCHACRLVIEIDGGIHTNMKEYDHQRDEFLQEKGYCVIRFSNDEVSFDLEKVLQSILRYCVQRSQRKIAGL